MDRGWLFSLMKQRIVTFVQSHAALLMLVLYGFFLILYKNATGFFADEATYAQVAKEGLFYHHFLTLSFGGVDWFEKPPLVLWLIEVAYKIFGVSEFSARLPAGLFGIASAGTLYFLGKELFGRKLYGFLAGFIFLTTSIIFFYSRNNMLDIPVSFFICLSALAVWKVWEGNKKWWLVYGVATGLAVMTKSVVGLLPFLFLLFFWSHRDVFRSRFFGWGMSFFLLVSAPWHIFMTFRFGWSFWREYFGYHVFDRMMQSIFLAPWQGDSPSAYFELFWEQSGWWIFVFLIFLILFCGAFIFRRTFFATRNTNSSVVWVVQHKKVLSFLLLWLVVVVAPFLLAKTKLPQYMVLAYYPLSLLVGGFIGYLVEEKKRFWLFLLAILSLFNFWPLFQERLFSFGEARFLLAKSVEHFFHLDALQSFLLVVICFFLLVSVLFKQRWTMLFCQSMLGVILLANTIIPFNIERNGDIKRLGEDLSDVSADQPIYLYYSVTPAFHAFGSVLPFYLPLGSSVIDFREKGVKIVPKNVTEFSSWCYIEKPLATNEEIQQTVFFSERGVVNKCEALE